MCVAALSFVVLEKSLRVDLRSRFLFDNQSAEHIYYRWKLFSILQVFTESMPIPHVHVLFIIIVGHIIRGKNLQ